MDQNDLEAAVDLSTSQIESVYTDWLPVTKLQPPPLCNDLLQRPRLVAALHESVMSRRLTLLSAPIGYGKTTLLSQWMHSYASPNSHTRCAVRAAWLTFDVSENTCTHFLLALIAALRTLHPKCGLRAQALLTTNGYPEPVDPVTQLQLLVGLVIVDISLYLPDPFVICFTNYERITEPTVQAAFDYLLRRLPGHAHIVFSTRRDPKLTITQLHMVDQLAVLRGQDLAFNQQESLTFLAERFGTEFTKHEQLMLHRCSEGWPTGLQLLARELMALPNKADHIQALAGSDDGFTEAALAHIAEFFDQELFVNLSPTVQTFLLQTSILTELTPTVCQTLCARTDSSDLLLKVSRQNLFVVPMSEPTSDCVNVSKALHKPGLRYHKLFAIYLRRRLRKEMPEQMIDLHARAAEAESSRIRKIPHYLAAQQWTKAAQAMSDIVSESVAAHDNGDFDSCQSRRMILSNWVKMLPKYILHDYPSLQQLLLLEDHPGAWPTNGQAIELNLTRRQREVLTLLAQGASNEEIAAELIVSLSTVKGHVSNILRMLHATTRHMAIARALELGIVTVDER